MRREFALADSDSVDQRLPIGYGLLTMQSEPSCEQEYLDYCKHQWSLGKVNVDLLTQVQNRVENDGERLQRFEAL